MAEGVGFVPKSITYYGLIERIYLEKDSVANLDPKQAAIIRWDAVVKYLS
jgi:hypothetical protein